MALSVAFHPDYVVPLPEGHRFPMAKFQALYEEVEALGAAVRLIEPAPVTRAEVARAHDAHWTRVALDGGMSAAEERRVGLPWSEALARRSLRVAGGTLLAAREALARGCAANLAGGSHHAAPGHGAGFCVLNDMGIALFRLLDEGSVSKALIIDLDVHQGDGTALMFKDEPRVFTFSVHCAENFPVRKELSDLDLALPAGTGDEDYLRALGDHVPGLISHVRPDLILLIAGADPHQDDRLGKLALSDNGLIARDRYIRDRAREGNIPLLVLPGGGYGPDLGALGRRHALAVKVAAGIL